MKALLLFLLLLPVPALADWTRTGLEFHALAPPPDPVVDRTRVAAQQARRCEASAIRFGDAAAMRGGAQAEWDDTTRTLAAIATIADRPETALTALPKAQSTSGDEATILDSQRILTALQFGQSPPVSTEALSGANLSDRLFWQAMTEAPTASTAQWRDRILPQLDAAYAADPTSFQVRAWRVIAWYKGLPGGSCEDRIADVSTRLLDLSEASACPLMLGHVTHAMDRALASRPETDPDPTRALWRSFGEALLAIVAGAPEVAAYRQGEIATSGQSCAGLMSSELRALREGGS